MKIHTECFGLKNYFSQMYCSGDYDFQPKYEIFNVIREACPGEYLVVGDRFHDMEIARYHKVYTAGCLYGFGSREELKDADVLLEDIRDLQKILLTKKSDRMYPMKSDFFGGRSYRIF